MRSHSTEQGLPLPYERWLDELPERPPQPISDIDAGALCGSHSETPVIGCVGPR